MSWFGRFAAKPSLNWQCLRVWSWLLKMVQRLVVGVAVAFAAVAVVAAVVVIAGPQSDV